MVASTWFQQEADVRLAHGEHKPAYEPPILVFGTICCNMKQISIGHTAAVAYLKPCNLQTLAADILAQAMG